MAVVRSRIADRSRERYATADIARPRLQRPTVSPSRRPGCSVREFGLQLFVTSDRGRRPASLMFVSSDRTGPLRDSEALTSANLLLLVAAAALC
jgi:hypothetical protein